ncbi:MAG: hypothetical protein R3A79_21115 [Nannocystaceae bacterium]
MIRQITATIDDYRMARRRVFVAGLVSFAVLSVGAIGYWYLGCHLRALDLRQGASTLTTITVTTVGFGEVIDVADVPGGREWTMILLLFRISGQPLRDLVDHVVLRRGDFGQITFASSAR